MQQRESIRIRYDTKLAQVIGLEPYFEQRADNGLRLSSDDNDGSRPSFDIIKVGFSRDLSFILNLSHFVILFIMNTDHFVLSTPLLK